MEGGRDHRKSKEKDNISQDFYLCTLNARTLRTTEREVELDNALTQIKFSILGLSELRKLGENIVEKVNGNILYFIGKTKGQKGVGFMVHRDLKQCIREFIGVSERIAVLRLETNVKTTVIQVYAPTENSSEEEIETFYEDLDRTITKYKDKRVYIMGDFNSKIGIRMKEEELLGPYGIGKRNDRGERLVQFAEENNLFILNSFYKKPPQAKWTWRSPDGKTKNEIDFILSNTREDVMDVQVINGLKFDSDHRMVRAKIKIHKKKRYVKKWCRPTVERINEKIFKDRLQERIKQTQGSTEKKVQELYDQLECCILQSAKDASSNKQDIRNKHKLSEGTIKLLEQREKTKQSMHKTGKMTAEYSELDRRTKREIRKDLRKYSLNQTRSILENSKSIKRVKKELEKGKLWMLGAKDSNGETIRSRAEIIEAATNFYKQIYDSNIPMRQQNLQELEREEDLPLLLNGEVENALGQLKSNKTPGDDGIINECLKWGKTELTSTITDLFNKIIETEEIPTQWQTSTIILIHKKGNRDDLNNYRPISLMSNLYKIFTKILTNRLAKLIDENQTPEQAGFRTGYSTVDHLHTINQVIEKAQEFNLHIYIAFIDYRKAFDSVEHESVLDALKTIGIHSKYIRLIAKIYMNCSTKVRTETEGETFRMKKGVRQGDPISPKLFTCTLESIFRKLRWDKKRRGININGKRLTNLKFADDIVIFSNSATELQEMLNELNEKSKEVGLQMNPTKTKLMTNSMETQIKVDNTIIEYCNDYIYLGQTVSFTENNNKEIQRRIRLAWGKFWSIKFILMDKYINTKTRFEILQSCVIPVLLYGSQTWTFTKTQIQTIQVCQRRMERKLLGITLKDKMRNEELRRRSGMEDAATNARILKWRWGGHVARLHQDRWAYATTMWDPRRGKRSRGRPRQRWRQEFSAVMGGTWTRVARDRVKWKEIVTNMK